MTEKTAAKQRTQQLKHLRELHQESVARAQVLLKEQQAIRRQVAQAMKGGARTIPDISVAAGVPSHKVLWHIAAMKKYDLVREVGKDGDYYQYALAKEDHP